MAKFRLRILEKFNAWDQAAEDAFNAITALPKYVVIKRPSIEITEYIICEKFVGDQFDRVASQLLTIEAEHSQEFADLAEAVTGRGAAEMVDGLIFEVSDPDGKVYTYSGFDGTDRHEDKNMIAEKKNITGDPREVTSKDDLTTTLKVDSVGAHRAEEGWSPASQIKPSGQAFNDSQLGVEEAKDKGFGNTLN